MTKIILSLVLVFVSTDDAYGRGRDRCERKRMTVVGFPKIVLAIVRLVYGKQFEK